MRINRIATDTQGFKLISAERERYMKARKPQSYGHLFFDYKDGVLREYVGNGFTQMRAVTFKDALSIVRSK